MSECKCLTCADVLSSIRTCSHAETVAPDEIDVEYLEPVYSNTNELLICYSTKNHSIQSNKVDFKSGL